MKVVQIPALQDNYFYLILCSKSGESAVIDPCDTKAAIQMCKEHNTTPTKILNTHHHWDHVSANEELKKMWRCEILALGEDRQRIPGFTTALKVDQQLRIGELQAQVLFTPGHTKNHISFYFEKDKALFCGDTLFSGGCGRLFDGTAEQMVHSLYEKIAILPDDTNVFCGHEYTENNLLFAGHYEPSNMHLREYRQEVARRRHQGKPSIPTTIGTERTINPFLRCEISHEIYENVLKHSGQVSFDRLSVFKALRYLKDHF